MSQRNNFAHENLVIATVVSKSQSALKLRRAVGKQWRAANATLELQASEAIFNAIHGRTSSGPADETPEHAMADQVLS